MTDEGPSRPTGGAGTPAAAADEISLFDIWNVLVRRRWVVLTVFVLVTAIAAAVALTRPTTYQLSQTIQVGEVDAGSVFETTGRRADMPVGRQAASEGVNIYLDAPRDAVDLNYFDTPETAATELHNLHIPAARSAFNADEGQEAALTASVSAQAVENTQLIRMTAEVPATRVGAYEELMSHAAERLVAAHEEAEKLTRRRFENAVTEARNAAAAIRDRLAARRSALERVGIQRDLIKARIKDLEQVVERTQSARLKAIEGQPDVAQAMSMLLVANELRQAKGELNALRERLAVELPADKAELENEVASLERRLAVAEGEVEALQAGMAGFKGTRVVTSPQRSGGPTGTPWAVIVALGAILGGVAGVLAAFFAEFVSAARVHRATSA
ncbi:hypothetical protein CKO28_15715 [Rhodovibrio sodomensis]|uniref:Polysaccharide chain length determinant N-terminal domain-containing protein n=1 Tax=Rhodovibrio sodomensis TaxID=1088 RepID=A0ABS1DHJ3_9PROT|nr:Wzz/FepE/Etk N-terminal domain-containing protein [Rhodovibrio sodomensis]MBK1669486.1 hypothetical protein [Rhodovibrio sodomensis]